jgi:hypothetical protein
LLAIAGPWSQQPAIAKEPSCRYADVHPSYPPLNAPPAVQAITVGSETVPPDGADCFGERKGALTWITVTSVTQAQLSPVEIIERFGAISELRDVQYWSTTEQAWRPMTSASFAVPSANSDQPRADFSAAELSGPTRYFRVADTRSYASINYSLEMHPSPPGHIVVETSNIDPVKKWGITLYEPDGLHTLYILNERAPGTWSYYSITRIVPATFLAKGNEKSYINRAVALYRHYLHLPATAEPPAAR